METIEYAAPKRRLPVSYSAVGRSALALLAPSDAQLFDFRQSKSTELEAGAVIDPANKAWAVLRGWAALAVDVSDGRRQVVELLLPGDWIGVAGPIGHPRAALVVMKTMTFADASPLRQAFRQAPPSSVLGTIAERARLRRDHWRTEQIVRLGRLNAFDRVARLLCEVHFRLGEVGLVDNDGFEHPLTQQMFADILGLSTVHVNRTLQEMRRKNLLDIKRGHARLLQPQALADASGFVPPSEIVAR